MGSTPSAYPLTSEQLKAMDANGADPLTSEELRTGYGLAATYTSANLLGLTDYTPMSTPSLSATTINHDQTGTGTTTCSGVVSCSVPTGGNASKTYTWEKVSGQTLTVSGTTQATFSQTAGGVATTSVYRCKVTDGTGTVYSNNVTINFTHYQLNAAAIVGDTDIVFAPDQATATVAVYRAGNASGGANWVTPVSSTVGDLFQVRFDYVSGSTLYTGSAMATDHTINTGRSVSISAQQSQAYKPTITRTVTVQVRIKRIGGSYLINKNVILTATSEGDEGGTILL